jgi:hypothetical protein
MKIIILLLMTVITTVNIYGQLNIGLKAIYPFGGNTDDVSGQNNDGQLVGLPVLTTDRFGTPDCAYEFPGDNLNFIEINYSSDFNIEPTGAFSISLWYLGGTSDLGDFEVLFEKNNPNVNPHPSDYHLGLYDLNKPSFGSQYSPVVMPRNAYPIPDTIWHHVVGIYDNKKWYIYQDDTLRDSDETQNSTIFQSTGNISIGKNFRGKIDDIRFYDRPLSVNEIHQIFLLPGSCQVSGVYEKMEQSFLNIFPNPTTNIIHISPKNLHEAIYVSVLDIFGREIIKKCLNTNEAMIDLSSYVNGLYLIIISDNGTIYSRIIEKTN